MPHKTALIVTTIAKPNLALKKLAQECLKRDIHFIVIGDESSPADFRIEGCDFYNIDRQMELDFDFACQCPTNHYARKNIGYLIAISEKAEIIIETDDDNFPTQDFWQDRSLSQNTKIIESIGWVNPYHYFTDNFIWPRGLALDEIRKPLPNYDQFPERRIDCPIQQGLVQENPDVDSLFRLLFELPFSFEKKRRLAMQRGTWCPFNSQNTTWFQTVFALMYLPAFCSFRMTDIWRSFIAQRILWDNNWGLLFHEATMTQKRNVHDLMHDFEDEVPGYLKNKKLCRILQDLSLPPGKEYLLSNLLACYEQLEIHNIIKPEEVILLKYWIEDFKRITKSNYV